MDNKKVWLVEDNISGHVYGAFSTKSKALSGIELWSFSGLHSYSITTDIEKIRKTKGSDFVRLVYTDGVKTTLWVHYMDINNSAGITSAHRHARKRG